MYVEYKNPESKNDPPNVFSSSSFLRACFDSAWQNAAKYNFASNLTKLNVGGIIAQRKEKVIIFWHNIYPDKFEQYTVIFTE